MEILNKQNNRFVRGALLVIGCVLFVINTVLEYNGDMAIPIAWYVLIVSAFLMITYRQKWELLMLFALLLFYNYGIMSAYYLSPINSFFTMYKTTVESYMCQNMIMLYMMTLCLITPRTIVLNKNVNIYTETEKKSDMIVYMITVVLLIIFILCFSRPEENQRGGGNPLYEYSLIFFIVGFLFSKGKKTDIILTIMLLAFSLQNFIYGGRIVGVQLLEVLFLMRFSHKWGFKKVFPMAIVFVIAMQFIGQTRGNYSDITNIFETIVDAVKNANFVNDTAYSAYHTSVTFVMTEAVGWGERLRIFKNFLLSMVLGGSAVPDSNLANYTRELYVHYYGGVLPIYIHFLLGNVGVVLSGVLTNFYINMIAETKKDSSMLVKGLGVYIVAGVSRWYLYSPSNLIRGCMLIYLVHTVFKKVENLISYKKHIIIVDRNREENSSNSI